MYSFESEVVIIKTKEKIALTFLCILNVLLSACLIVVTFLTKDLINVALTHDQSKWNILLRYAGCLIGVVVIQITFKIIYNFIFNKASINYELELKEKIYQSYLLKDISQIRFIHSGEMSNIYINDVKNVTD